MQKSQLLLIGFTVCRLGTACVSTCPAGVGCTFQSGCCCCSSACRRCLQVKRQSNRLQQQNWVQQSGRLLAKGFHDGVGVQHPPLYPFHCVLTLEHCGRGRHSGVILHQATRRPCLQKGKISGQGDRYGTLCDPFHGSRHLIWPQIMVIPLELTSNQFSHHLFNTDVLEDVHTVFISK